MLRRRAGIGSHQILDQSGSGTVSAPKGAVTGVAWTGTLWPLLPEQSYRIYNVGLNAGADVDRMLIVSSIAIQIGLQDAGGNIAGRMTVAAENYTDPCYLNGNGNGLFISADGDPLVEFFANLNAVGSPDAGANPPAFFYAAYYVEVFNSDMSNDHSVLATGQTLFSALAL